MMKFDRDDHFFPGHSDDQFSPPIEGSDFSRASEKRPGRLALIGCFRPRQCGIATFTADVFDHLSAHSPDMAIDVYAMRSQSDQPVGTEVRQAIDEKDVASYRDAADAINASGADAVWLQHEFGIFGGSAGDMVLELVDRVAAPLIVTLHTVLAEPSPEQRQVMDRLVARASKLVVMSDYGLTTLTGIYGASPDQVVLIEHGTPDRPFEEVSGLRQRLDLADRPILSTFGLIGPGKGLEAAIRALPVEAMGELFVLQDIAASIGVFDAPDAFSKRLRTLSQTEAVQLGERYLASVERRRRTDRRYFTDKMPANWRFTALIHRILPGARIIDARREPMACCFSAYATYFNRHTDFPNTLPDLGGYYRQYVRMMEIASSLRPDKLYRLDHAQLVSNSEQEIRSLLRFLRLPFSVFCLAPEENPRAIYTPSAQQVRSPIQPMKNRLRGYLPWLGPLKDALDAAN